MVEIGEKIFERFEGDELTTILSIRKHGLD